MNYSIILYILSWVVFFEGIFMLMPFAVSLIYGESAGVIFLCLSLVCTFLGAASIKKKPKNTLFYAREGFVAVALSWIILSIIGALPFLISGEIPSLADALFETVSGFTTTGASILHDVEAMSKCLLIWRSFTHWIGGMGVLVFILAILPLSGGQNMHLMRAESPGPDVGKLVPKVQKTAVILYGIYIFMTLVEICFLLAGKMPVFDALCTAFGTAGTGGFGIKADSIAGYSPYLQGVITVFMMLFGVNFNFYFLLLFRKPKEAFGSEEVRCYFFIYFTAVALMTINLMGFSGNLLYNFHHAAFQASSVMTTTGFSTLDFDVWPQFSRTMMVILMFIGACAGSTGGGIKVSRLIIYLKTVREELSMLIHPRSVRTIKMEKKPVDAEVIRTANVYLITYAVIFTVSMLLIGLDGHDLTTNFTAIAATFNNIGPGLGLVGPSRNFDIFSDISKYILIFDMLAGRLELFPLLLIFSPATWRK